MFEDWLALASTNRVLKTIVAFANTAGGMLLIGGVVRSPCRNSALKTSPSEWFPSRSQPSALPATDCWGQASCSNEVWLSRVCCKALLGRTIETSTQPPKNLTTRGGAHGNGECLYRPNAISNDGQANSTATELCL